MQFIGCETVVVKAPAEEITSVIATNGDWVKRFDSVAEAVAFRNGGEGIEIRVNGERLRF